MRRVTLKNGCGEVVQSRHYSTPAVASAEFLRQSTLNTLSWRTGWSVELSH